MGIIIQGFIFFSRLNIEDEELQELLDDISQFPDLKCICFKNESLHLSKGFVGGAVA